MDRTSVHWRGYWPAAPTPYTREDGIDVDALRSLLNLYIDLGVHGVLVNGTTGEWWSQSAAERRQVAEVTLETVNNRIPVVVGCSSFTPGQVVELAVHAAGTGAAGVLATPPPYAHPTQLEIAAFYEKINAGIALPLMVYNWPRGTGVEIDVETAVRIAELDHVVALKNSTSNWSLVLDCIEALIDDVRIFGALISPRGLAIMRELGGDGYIDGGALGAQFAVPFFEAVWEERFADARDYARKYSELTDSLYRPDFSGRWGSRNSQLKAAMAILGQPGGHVRPPLLPTTDPESLSAISEVLRTAELLAEEKHADGVR